MSRNILFIPGTGNGPEKIASYLVPRLPPHRVCGPYPAHALQRAKLNSSQRSSRRVVMSGEQEDDLVDKSCVYISWNVATLMAILSGLSGGRQQREAGKYIIQIFTTQVVQEVRYIRSSEERQQIMRACHAEPTSGHYYGHKTYHLYRITARFFWKGLTKDVDHMVRKFCQ